MTKQSNNGKFRGYFPRPHGIYSREFPQASEQKAAERRAKEQAKHERFRRSCERGRRFLSEKEILEYWLTQAEIAMSGPRKYWGDTKKFSWPKDKAIIYAVMMICIENTGSAIRVIPDSLQQTKNYKFNEYVWTWVENLDLAAGLMNYIEADLKEEGLLPSTNEINLPAEDERPKDLITLTKVVAEFQVSRKTVKEDIYAGNIKSYRTSEKGMHRVSRAKLTYLPKEF